MALSGVVACGETRIHPFRSETMNPAVPSAATVSAEPTPGILNVTMPARSRSLRHGSMTSPPIERTSSRTAPERSRTAASISRDAANLDESQRRGGRNRAKEVGRALKESVGTFDRWMRRGHLEGEVVFDPPPSGERRSEPLQGPLRNGHHPGAQSSTKPLLPAGDEHVRDYRVRSATAPNP